MSQRPWCCPEPRCLPVVNMHDGDWLDITKPEPGRSVFCWGVMERAVEFVYDGVEHSNDRSFCIYTPLKGAIRFQVNQADLGIIASGTHLALDEEFVGEVRKAWSTDSGDRS